MLKNSDIATQNDSGTDNTDAAEKRYKIFILIWGIATLLHMARSELFVKSFDLCFLTISIAILIAKPSSIIRLMLFLAVQAAVTFRYMPNVSNHEVFFLFANLTILQALVYLSVKKRSININREAFYETFAPVIRIELIILYFYVVFHKLNTDFFNPAVSCATDFYREQNSYKLLPSSSSMYMANAYFTIFVEALIPLLLCLKKTRDAGLIIGASFHFVIAYNPINRFFDISAAIFAAYVLFMDYNFSNTVVRTYQKTIQVLKTVAKHHNRSKLMLLGLVFVFITLCVFTLNKIVQDYFRYIIWTAFSVGFIYCVIVSIVKKRTREEFELITFKIRRPAFYIIPILIFFNGLCPYIGLKTNYSFSMFSNLRTEGGITNHLFVPVELQIFDYQKDIVEIISSSNPNFQKIADKKELLVFFSFNRLIHYLHPQKVEYVRNGKHFNYDSSRPLQDQDLKNDNPYLLHKLLNFRTIKKYDPQPCSH